MATSGLRARAPGPDPLLDVLFPRAPSVVDWGLGRMEAALAQLGHPHTEYRCLHVGGTNGKGSVASMWESVLRVAGHRTGLYTSPHLCSFRERVMIDGEPLSEAILLRTAGTLRPLTEELEMSLFEACTLLALVSFREHGVEWASIEVGLGGRLDATNVIDSEVTAITNVAMDHQEYLGRTLAEIAREKAGIVKSGVPVVTAEDRLVALDVIQKRADDVGASLHRIEPWRDIVGLSLGPRGTSFTLGCPHYGNLKLETPLPGAHQATNAALAVRALEMLDRPPPVEAVCQGVADVVWPGRADIHHVGGLRLIFDVAHNRAAVAALARLLADLGPPRPLVALVGILGDKDWPRMLPPLLDFADHSVFTVPTSAPLDRHWDPHAAAQEVGSSEAVEVWEVFEEAVGRSMALAQGGGTVVITGSCHTVGDALLVLGIDPFGGSGARRTVADEPREAF